MSDSGPIDSDRCHGLRRQRGIGGRHWRSGEIERVTVLTRLRLDVLLLTRQHREPLHGSTVFHSRYLR